MIKKKGETDNPNININCGWKDKSKCNASGGGAYFLGFLGAAIYFLQNTDGFWLGVLAILKAIIWPVFVVYHLLGL